MTTQLKIPLGAVNIQIKGIISSTVTFTGSWATGLRYFWSLRLLYLTCFVCIVLLHASGSGFGFNKWGSCKSCVIKKKKKTKQKQTKNIDGVTWEIWAGLSHSDDILWLSLHQIVTGFCTGEWWEERLGGGDKDCKTGQKSEAKLVWCVVVAVGVMELVV